MAWPGDPEADAEALVVAVWLAAGLEAHEAAMAAIASSVAALLGAER